MKTSLRIFGLLLWAFGAQAEPAVEMADQFRADGKIYVVVAVALLILLGLLGYVLYLDQKIKGLEDKASKS